MTRLHLLMAASLRARTPGCRPDRRLRHCDSGSATIGAGRELCRGHADHSARRYRQICGPGRWSTATHMAPGWLSTATRATRSCRCSRPSTRWARILNGQRTGDFASSGTRSAHKLVAGGLGVLFAVNSVTGVWNMIEARHDPSGRTRRNLHGLSMLLADAGFLYTASLAGAARESQDGANRHRNAALASIGVATASTLMMWLWKD